MFLNSNFGGKPSLVKPAIIMVVVAVAAFGAYKFFKKPENNNPNDPSFAAQEIMPSGIDKDQKVSDVGDVEEIIAKWIEANPKAVLASVANMQRKMMEDQTKNAQKNIGAKKSEIFNDKNSPSYSPKGYNITIVEFFDYNCGYCKKTSATVDALLKSDAKIRVVYKEFPILGQLSEEMSSIALAVNMVDSSSYKKFHDALMNSHAQSKEEVLAIVKENGINVSKVENVLKSQKDKIASIIANNRSLGSSIGINGTPGFIIGEELIPGAIELSTFQQKIAEQRKK